MMLGGLERGDGFPRSRRRSHEVLRDVAVALAIGVGVAVLLTVVSWLI